MRSALPSSLSLLLLSVPSSSSSLPWLSLLLAAAASIPSPVLADGAVWATPHDSYSSSVGVLGCKIDTDRVAYWPGSVDCDNLCISLSYGGRTVKLLRVDQSQGAHDVSYDAWNYLYTGQSAKKAPVAGGAVAMEYKELPAGECGDLINTKGGKLPLSASNSMNFLASCLAQPDSWVARNHVLYNVLDSICEWGFDEVCELDWPAANQPTCKHALGTPVSLKDEPVYNVMYPSGDVVVASTGQTVSTPGTSAAAPSTTPHNGASSLRTLTVLAVFVMSWTCFFMLGSW